MPKAKASLGRGLGQADPAFGVPHAEEARQIDIQLRCRSDSHPFVGLGGRLGSWSTKGVYKFEERSPFSGGGAPQLHWTPMYRSRFPGHARGDITIAPRPTPSTRYRHAIYRYLASRSRHPEFNCVIFIAH